MAYIDEAEIYKAYQILGVLPGDSPLTIKRAYRKLVIAFNPDRFAANSSGKAYAEKQIKLINEAYSVIQDAPFTKASTYTSKAVQQKTQQNNPPYPHHTYNLSDAEPKNIFITILMNFGVGLVSGAAIYVFLIFLAYYHYFYYHIDSNLYFLPKLINHGGLLILSCGILGVIFRGAFFNIIADVLIKISTILGRP